MSRSTPTSSKSKVKAVLFALVLPILAGCFSRAEKLPASAYGRLPFPSKDEVLLVDGQALSLTDYFDIRRRVGPTPDKDSVVWIGEASLLLQEEWGEKGKHLDSAKAVLLAGYAQGIFSAEQVQPFFEGHFPSAKELFSDIESRRARAAVKQNSILIAELK